MAMDAVWVLCPSVSSADLISAHLIQGLEQ
jgi:hypothetical protein